MRRYKEPQEVIDSFNFRSPNGPVVIPSKEECSDDGWKELYATTDALSKPVTAQVGGDHYAEMSIQPIDYILANDIGYCEGNGIKYLSRHKSKGGAEDIRKVKQYCDFILWSQYGEERK